MLSDVMEGLSRPQKELSPKYFYDAPGSHLFEEITQLPEYYLTRTEASIMAASVAEIAQRVGPDAAVIEFGSGAGEKIRVLLHHLQTPVAFVPIEISRDHLLASANALAQEHPELDVIAVCADFTQPIELPPIAGARRKLVFFPGSTIGNFPPEQAVSLLKLMNQAAGEDGALLIGADLVKDSSLLEAAYNDSAGITAAFNLNLLAHINRELHSDFDLDDFQHRAEYNARVQRIEMYLVSQRATSQCTLVTKPSLLTEVNVSSRNLLINTSWKASPGWLGEAGLRVGQVWTDPQQHFSVQYLVRATVS